MAIATHCPSVAAGTLGTGQLIVPNFPGAPGTIFPHSGSGRAVVIYLHGLGTNAGEFPAAPSNFIFLETTLIANLQAAGYEVIFCQEVGDSYVTNQNDGWFHDLNNDAGKGSRLNSTIVTSWWTHALNYCALHYAGWPIIVGGSSLGGLLALMIATQRTASIAGYFCQVPAVQLWPTTGLPITFDVAPVTSAYSGSTITNFANPGTLQLTSNPFTPSGCLTIASTGIGAQIIRYTSIDGGNLAHGVTGGSGSANVVNGAVVGQSSFTSGLDIPNNALASLGNGSQGTPPPGYLCWETGDAFVQYANTLALFNASTGVTGRPVSGGGHQMNTADVNAICDNPATTASWFGLVMNPLCPAVH